MQKQLFELEISTLQEDAGEKQRPNCWCEPTWPEGKKGRQNTGLRMRCHCFQEPSEITQVDFENNVEEQVGEKSAREILDQETSF